MNNLLLKLGMENISDFFDECYEKALKDEGLPFWLTEKFVRDAAKEFPFLKKNFDEVISAIPHVVENPDLVLFAKTLYYMLEVRKHHEEVFGGLKFPKAPKGENPLSYDMFAFYPLFARILDTYRELRAKGADEDILTITAQGVGGSLGASSKRVGRLALNETYFLWLTTHKNGALFKIDRFSLEIRDNVNLNVRLFKNKNDEFKVLMAENMEICQNGFVLGSAGAEEKEGSFVTVYTETESYYEGNEALDETATVKKETTRLLKEEWELIYAPGDSLISVHIPADGSFDKEVVRKSLERGKEVLKRLYPDVSFKGFMCISWLLAPELKKLLKETSNILAFADLYEKFPTKCSGLDVFSFVFVKAVSKLSDVDLDSLPENSSLERNLKSFYKEGNFVHETGGIIPF